MLGANESDNSMPGAPVLSEDQRKKEEIKAAVAAIVVILRSYENQISWRYTSSLSSRLGVNPIKSIDALAALLKDDDKFNESLRNSELLNQVYETVLDVMLAVPVNVATQALDLTSLDSFCFGMEKFSEEFTMPVGNFIASAAAVAISVHMMVAFFAGAAVSAGIAFGMGIPLLIAGLVCFAVAIQMTPSKQLRHPSFTNIVDEKARHSAADACKEPTKAGQSADSSDSLSGKLGNLLSRLNVFTQSSQNVESKQEAPTPLLTSTPATA